MTRPPFSFYLNIDGELSWPVYFVYHHAIDMHEKGKQFAREIGESFENFARP